MRVASSRGQNPTRSKTLRWADCQERDRAERIPCRTAAAALAHRGAPGRAAPPRLLGDAFARLFKPGRFKTHASSAIWRLLEFAVKRTYRQCPSTKTQSEEHTSELQSLRHLVCRLL